MLPMSMRKAASEAAYQQAKVDKILVPLSAEPSIKEFDLWRVIANRFPYDIALAKHHLLLPKREVPDRFHLTKGEASELLTILLQFERDGSYDFVMDNFAKRRSILAHYHLHLGSYYATREEMSL